MKETSSSEKFLLKHFGKKDISVELQNLSEDKLSSLEIKEANFDRAIKYKNGKTTYPPHQVHSKLEKLRFS